MIHPLHPLRLLADRLRRASRWNALRLPAPVTLGLLVVVAAVVAPGLPTRAAVLYVRQDSPAPAPPYDSWNTAAHVIQDAVDAARDGDTVLVTNGVYTTGGRIVQGRTPSRVAITRSILVRSIEGPAATIIEGAPGDATRGGDGAVRCVHLGRGATLSGFTLRNGHTRTDGHYEWDQSGGGVWSEPTGRLLQCTLTHNVAGHLGGGAYRAELINCRVVANRARYGGGTCQGEAFASDYLDNSAEFGGGAYHTRLGRCRLIGNRANMGGGLVGASLSDGRLEGNLANQWGGGAYQARLVRCTLEGNRADRGGGAHLSTLEVCVVTDNVADLGGGTFGGTLRQSTVVGNLAGIGGGVYLGSLDRCLVYFNDATLGPNHRDSTFDRSRTTPLPERGSDNTTGEPHLASLSHLSADAPREAGGAPPVDLGTDLDGEAWQSPSWVGADRFVPGAAVGSLQVAIDAPTNTFAVRFAGKWTARIQGRTTSSTWDLGDGRLIRNQPVIRPFWSRPGTYTVTLSAFNESNPRGVRTSLEIRVVEQPVHYVDAASPAPAPPFTDWTQAARTVQDAIEAATVPGSLVLVTNGVYDHGAAAAPASALVHRIVVDRPVVVRSVNGPSETFIVGAGPVGPGAVRAAYVGADAILSGFTLTNGHTFGGGASRNDRSGGAITGHPLGLVTNCVLTGNRASLYGGGAYRARLSHCLVTDNLALDIGGGAFESRLLDSSLVSNTASNAGGGLSYSELARCLVAGNAAPLGGGAYYGFLESCRIQGNDASSDGYGGGVHGGTLRDCVLSTNRAYSGGGAYAATLETCRLEFNEARRDGGGSSQGTLLGCRLVGNAATHGGGASEGYLFDCDLATNRASVAGGGANGSTLDQCRLLGNSAYYGGASARGTLDRCEVRDNSATFGGGGYHDFQVNVLSVGNRAEVDGGAAFRSLLLHTTATGNSAASGGGTFDGTNLLSIVYFNTATAGPDSLGSTMIGSCTPASPSVPPDNVTRPPRFVNPGAGDYRLRADSPCIDAGGPLPDSWVTPLEDLVGFPRGGDGNHDQLPGPDLGAYEYDPETTDSNLDGIPDGWARRYGFDPFDPDVARGNPDQDRLDNYQEWLAGTDPTDPASDFSVVVSNLPPVTLYLPGATGRYYTLLQRTRVGTEPNGDGGDDDAPAESWTPVPGRRGVLGRGGLLALDDPTPPREGARFYRVEVGLDTTTRPRPAAGTNDDNAADGGRRSVGASGRFRPEVGTLHGEATIPSYSPAAVARRSGISLTHDPGHLGPHPGEFAPLPSLDGGTPPPPRSITEAGPRPDAVFDPFPILPEPGRVDLPGASPRGSGVDLASARTEGTSETFRIHADSELPISPMLRGQEPFMLYAHSARIPTLQLGRGATFRGVAGGTDAETYDWRDVSAASRPHQWSWTPDDPPVVTTLEWLQEAREFDAELVLTVNTRGSGRRVLDDRGRRIWAVAPEDNRPEAVARLAADWVRYANLVAPRHRLTADGRLPSDLASRDPEADRLLRQLAGMGYGTNGWSYRLSTRAAPEIEVDPPIERPWLEPESDLPPTRKVTYWEIGNEVEIPMDQVHTGGFRSFDPAINLPPDEYVERYLRITEAMRRVDPTIKVGPSPNNPWGPRPGIDNRHLVELLARPEAVVDVLYYHFYYVWTGSYDSATDVSRNLRSLKNHGHLLHSQFASRFSRAGRTPVPAIISEWNPDWNIHPPVERFLLSAMATAEVFFTFVELQVLGAHYWENPNGRASWFVFDKLLTHLGDRFLGSSIGTRVDDGSYARFGPHPASSSDTRIYATRRSADSKVFVWLLNFSPTRSHTVRWHHPRPVADARQHTLRDPDPEVATTLYTPHTRLAWVTRSVQADQPLELPPATLAVLELDYAETPRTSPPPTLDSVRPADAAGVELVLEGTGFGPNPADNVVRFGTCQAEVLQATPNRLRVRVPTAATYGPVQVTAGGRTATSREFFGPPPRSDDADPPPELDLRLLPRRVYPPEGAPQITVPVDLLLADWEGIGRLELAGITRRVASVLPSTIDLYVNESTPGFPEFSTPTCAPLVPDCALPLNSYPTRMACGDLDGDGRLDLASIDQHAWHVALRHHTPAGASRRFDLESLVPTGATPADIVIHDLDQDGRPDLVLAHQDDDSIGFHRNLSPGPGTLAFGLRTVFRPDDTVGLKKPHALAVGDLVGDARPDIVVASRPPSGLRILRNHASPGTLELAAFPPLTPETIQSVALGDVDGDGHLDIVGVAPAPVSQLVVWHRQGTEAFVALRFPAANDPRQVRLADLDGDGRVEAITVNNDTGSISVYPNRSAPGSVAFDPRRDLPLEGLFPNDPVCLVAGDVDGDGRVDLAVGHYYSGFVGLIHNLTGRR